MTSLTLQQTMLVPIGSLDAYIQRVNTIPMLSAEEEQQYASRFCESGDLDSARQLILPHLRYVVRVARSYLGYGLPLGDLIQEGNVGLMKAVKRFDPTLGVRLASFAVHWIKAEIHEFVLKNWRIVKVATTKAQRKLFFNLRQMKKRLGWFDPKEIEAVASDLGVSVKDVMVMEQRLNAMDSTFDWTEGDDEANLAPAQYLQDTDSDPARVLSVMEETQQGEMALHAAMAKLDARSQDILKQRWLLEDQAETLHSIAERYGISAERVRQLEKNAMKKLKQYLVTLS